MVKWYRWLPISMKDGHIVSSFLLRDEGREDGITGSPVYT